MPQVARLARVLDLPYLREPQRQGAGDTVGAVEETVVYTDAHWLIRGHAGATVSTIAAGETRRHSDGHG